MSDQIDISQSMVEHLCHIHRGYEQHGTVAMLLALRAALDAADAEKVRAVEAERERCAVIAEVQSQSNNPYISGLAMRLAAAIRTGAKP